MKTAYLLAAAAVLILPAMETEHYGMDVAVAPASQDTGDFSWRKRMSPGQTLEIKGVNGGIRAVIAEGDEAEVTASKKSRRSDPDEVEIKVMEHSEGVTICAVYPTPRRARNENECAPGDEGHMSTENNDVEVSFVVKVPRGVRYVGHTVNGEIRAAGLESDVEVETVNGDVRVSTSGRAMANTVNGSIDASMGRADWEEDVSFSTVNGGITLDLPSEVNAELRASTVNGDIVSDFPVTVRGRFGPRTVRGTLGRGGPELELETVNGSITLRKAN
jgi:Putative adhesin